MWEILKRWFGRIPRQGSGGISDHDLLRRMRADWDRRARENARYFVATEKREWTDEEFVESGEITLREEILTDLTNICQGKNPAEMRVLEIGCGAGRVTNALAGLFGEVHAVDVSSEMIAHAGEALRGFANVHLYLNNGKDLAVVPEVPFDFAFSTLVFQHIPSHHIIESYVKEVSRLLRPGALFKFQVQGDSGTRSQACDTWLGAPLSEKAVIQMADRCGFECRHQIGAGTQYYWLWFFKREF